MSRHDSEFAADASEYPQGAGAFNELGGGGGGGGGDADGAAAAPAAAAATAAAASSSSSSAAAAAAAAAASSGGGAAAKKTATPPAAIAAKYDALADAATAVLAKPRILLMGLRRSGKSSIVKVVFHKLAPNETLFLESTTKISKSGVAGNSYIHFDVWDFPGQINYFDSDFDSQELFGRCDALIFVIDIQEEDFTEALQKLSMTISHAHKVNKNIKFDVFLHKVDGLSDDHKVECQDEIQQRAEEDLREAGLLESVPLRFHMTSIYDHSIFEGFSKVVQQLVPNMSTLEHLLDMLYTSCRLEKAFLIDVVSKLYIASDTAVLDPHSYELCSDMIDVVVDVSCIYGSPDDVSPLAYDDQSRGIIKLANGMILYLREMTKHLALVCLLRKENFDKHGVLEYNFVALRDAIRRVFSRPALAAASKK